jgi:hypothetical protein
VLHRRQLQHPLGVDGCLAGDHDGALERPLHQPLGVGHGEHFIASDASPLVALAEAVTIQKQDVKEFESLLNRALAINPDANPETRLLNTVMQRRARWLLSRKSELFLVE